jgi:hypothetical protein
MDQSESKSTLIAPASGRNPTSGRKRFLNRIL